MLEPVDVRKSWDRIIDFLDMLLEKTGAQDWKSEDIYSACVTNNASAYMPDDDREGVLILRLNENPFTGDRFLFVWVAYSPEDNAQEVFGDEIMELAKEHGCSYVEFESGRNGWQRRGGWTMHNTTYRKEVT